MNFWRLMTFVWVVMSLMLLYTYVVDEGGNRMFAELAFLMLQALMAHTAGKKVVSERE